MNTPPVLSTGYRGNPQWRDMSEYAVHFTKPANSTSAYDVMLAILWEGRIRTGGPFGAARRVAGLGESQCSACLSEIPLDLLARLIQRRSLYGIGFRQDFLVEKGGARVWYLDKDGTVAAAFKEVVRSAESGEVDPSAPLWKVTPFVDYPGDYGGTQYRFEWEREWRVPRPLEFQPEDVAFLFIPEELHAAARTFFEEHLQENTGPAYLCPYVDPRWDMPTIQQAFAPIQGPPTVAAQVIQEDTCPYCGGWVEDDQCVDCGNYI
jgi:hypothetical protein